MPNFSLLLLLDGLQWFTPFNKRTKDRATKIFYLLLFLLAFTSADIIFHKFLELHSTLSEKKIFVTNFSFLTAVVEISIDKVVGDLFSDSMGLVTHKTVPWLAPSRKIYKFDLSRLLKIASSDSFKDFFM